MKLTSLLASSIALLLLAPITAPAASTSGLSLPVMGTVDGGGAFTGTFQLQRFAMQAGKLVAAGQLSGVLTDTTGKTTTVFQTATMPVTATMVTASATSTALVSMPGCGILHLELGPLDLDLLGLVVHLDRIVLDISAEPGAGNLLGNLLCAIAGLLDSPGSNLVRLLNELLAIL